MTPQQGLEQVLPTLRTPFGRQMSQGYIGGQMAQLGPQKPTVVGKSLVDPRTGKVIMTDPSVAAESQAAREARAVEGTANRTAREQQSETERQFRADQAELQRRHQAEQAALVASLRGDKPITENQGKSALYGTRAATSDRTLQDLEDDISTTGLAAKQALQNVPLIGGALGAAGNLALSPAQQRVEQAQRDFVNAVLRQESGAVISPQEFDNAKKQYFPQPGDKPDVIAQKRRNRQIAIGGFRTMAGPAVGEIDAALAAMPSLKKNPQSRKGDAAPVGVDKAIWDAMTDSERALFR
jgi:hypothetical protein